MRTPELKSFLIFDLRFAILKIKNLKTKVREALCLVVCILCLVSSSHAEEPAVMMGLRSLGMGGASVAVANDEELFFSNPAALTQIENSVFSSVDLKSGFSHESIPFLSRMNKYGSDGSLSDLTPTQVRNLYILEPLYKVNGPINITYIRRYFGFGLFESFDLKFDPVYYSSGSTSVRVNAKPTTFGMVSFAGGVGLPPRPSSLSIGVTLKCILRAEVNQQDIDQMLDQGVIAEIGRGFSLDLGALYKLRETCAVGLMVRDALSSRFVWGSRFKDGNLVKKKSVRETEMKPCVAVGASFTPNWEIPLVLQDFRLALDLDKLRSPELGAETTLRRFLKLRAGASDDGVAFGLGFRLGMFVFDYAFISGFKDEYAGHIDNPSHFVSMSIRL